MFVKGAEPNKIFYEVYPPHMEDFASKNISQLDTWVFDKVKDFFESARYNATLEKLLEQNGVVFFLHLLGIDTNGHSNKPHSNIYTENIRIVDQGVADISKLIEEFYGNDDRTAFLFTADHGMTNWGSHGAGSPDETMTPLIAWGSGVTAPGSILTRKHDDLPGLLIDLPQRRDVEQADICPLMAALIGVPLPTNSVGRVPLAYLDFPLSVKVEIAKSNCLQILKQFKTKRSNKKRSSYTATFREFGKLSPSMASNNLRYAADLANRGEFDKSIKLYEQTRDLALEGIEYYHKYDRLALGTCIAITFILWIALLLIQLLPSKSKLEAHIDRSWSNDGVCSENPVMQMSLRNFVLLLSLCLLMMFMYVEQRPWIHWLYHSLPILLVWYASKLTKQIKQLMSILLRHHRQIFVALILLEILVWSFFHRFLLSIGMLIIGFSPFFDQTIGGPRNKTRLKLAWFAICTCLSVFPLLPVIGGYVNLHLVFLGGCGSSLLASYVYFNMRGIEPIFSGYREFVSSRLLLIGPLLASVVVISSHKSIALGGAVPVLYQIISWTSLVSLVPIACWFPAQIGPRLFGLSLALMSIYVLLSIAYEAIFVLFLILLAWTWNLLENQPDTPQWFSTWTEKYLLTHTISKEQPFDQPTSGKDVRRGILFIFLLFFSYFGTGNIASINSFDPNSVYCFVTVFQPFVMGSLMMIKIMIPLLIVSCAYVALQWNSLRLIDQCYLTMAVADLTALHFFWMIQDSGSWLHIGTSISHYLISMGTSTAALLFLSLGRCLLQVRLFCRDTCRTQIKEHLY